METKRPQPYVVAIKNTSNEDADAILFGGITQVQQADGISILSAMPNVSYQDLLIQLFLQVTEVGKIVFVTTEGKDFPEGYAFYVKSWDANGNTVQIPISIGNSMESIQRFNINALTSLIIRIPAVSTYTIFVYPSYIKKDSFAEELYKIVSTESFKKLLQSK